MTVVRHALTWMSTG